LITRVHSAKDMTCRASRMYFKVEKEEKRKEKMFQKFGKKGNSCEKEVRRIRFQTKFKRHEQKRIEREGRREIT